MIYRLGTRKSDLAVTQSRFIQSKLLEKGIQSELIYIEGQGDQDRKTPLYEIEAATPGLFTKQLEVALQNKEIDFAVHSLKDLPTKQPEGLTVAAIPLREDACDVLVLKENNSLVTNNVVGTSSLRREALVRENFPQVKVASLRGNVPTRIKAVREGKFDAVILAGAGLNRLKLDLTGLEVKKLDPAHFVPAPAQGALAVETRTDCAQELFQAIHSLEDANTALSVRIERQILAGLFGGCTLPLGVWVRREAKILKLNAFLGVLEDRKSPSRVWKSYRRFDISDASEQTLVEKSIAHFREYV